LAAQVARGVAIAVVGAAGIRFFQDVLAPATGRAMAMYANASAAGALLAGALAGLAVQHWGSPSTLLACGATAVAGAEPSP
jgi:MFS transporter, SET family, sugar efflux transporter